jgi:hypothetical protein
VCVVEPETSRRFSLRDGGKKCEIALHESGVVVRISERSDVVIPWSRLAHLYVEDAYLNRFEVLLLAYDDDRGRRKIQRVFADAGDAVLVQVIDALLLHTPEIDRRGLTRPAAYAAVGIRSFPWLRRAGFGMALLIAASLASASSLSRLTHPRIVVAEPDELPNHSSYVVFKNARVALDDVIVESEVRRPGGTKTLASYAAIVGNEQLCGRARLALRSGGARPITESEVSDAKPVVVGRYDGWWTKGPQFASTQQVRRSFVTLSRLSPPQRECTTFDDDVAVFDPELTPARDGRVVASWFSAAIALAVAAFFIKRSRERRPQARVRVTGPYR